MKIAVSIGLILLLLYVFWEDQKNLALPLWVFPLLAINWSIAALLHTPFYLWLQYSLINTALVLIAMLLLRQYALWRYGYFINKVFGLGDVFFLYAFAWGYPPQIFLALWIGGSLSALLAARFLRLHFVPYAGYLAFAIAVMLIGDLFLPQLNLLAQAT